MPDQPVVVDSTPAETEDVFNGQQVSLREFSKYRQDGELPERFKPNDTPEETAATEAEEPKPEPESEPDETQDPPQKVSGAEKRIKQLLAEKKELERKLAGKQDVQPESSPAPEPQSTRTKPTANDNDKDGKPKYSTYEDFVEDLADWKAEQRMETAKREQAQQESQKALKSKLDEARARYDDADDVIFPANQAIQNAKMPLVVKEVFAQSDVFIDLCYVVGSDPEELKKFISLAQTNPRAAIGKVFEYERGIREELSKESSTPRDDKGKFTAPEAKKTSAPKPPSPVGGASSRAFDVSDESLSAEQWALKRNQDIQKRRS
jgi:hypothetical protein